VLLLSTLLDQDGIPLCYWLPVCKTADTMPAGPGILRYQFEQL